MRINKTSIIQLAFLPFLLSSCVSDISISTRVLDDARTLKNEVMIIEINSDSDDFTNAVRHELNRYGIKFSNKNTTTPQQSILKISVTTEKKWDVTYYYKNVSLKILDAKSNAIIAESLWTNGFHHGNPTPQEIANELVFTTLSRISEIKRLRLCPEGCAQTSP